MSELLREWVEQTVINDAVMRETQLRLVIRDRPRWLSERVYRWVIGKLLVLEERDTVRAASTTFPTDEDVADAAHALADFHMDFEDHGSYAHWLEPARLALLAVADARRTEEAE